MCLDGEDGIQVPNKNVEEYAQALMKLADKPELRQEYGKNGKKRVMENFLYSQFSRNIHSVIDSL